MCSVRCEWGHYPPSFSNLVGARMATGRGANDGFGNLTGNIGAHNIFSEVCFH